LLNRNQFRARFVSLDVFLKANYFMSFFLVHLRQTIGGDHIGVVAYIAVVLAFIVQESDEISKQVKGQQANDECYLCKFFFFF
jgi:hypothetical protein